MSFEIQKNGVKKSVKTSVYHEIFRSCSGRQGNNFSVPSSYIPKVSCSQEVSSGIC